MKMLFLMIIIDEIEDGEYDNKSPSYLIVK